MDNPEVKFDFNRSLFSDFLHSDHSEEGMLDLSSKSLLECMEIMCEVKKGQHPKIRNNYSVSRHNIERLQKDFKCTLNPQMVNSVFWSNFIPYLLSNKLKLSSIYTIKAQIIAVLNWSSKYGVRLSSSYNDVTIPKYRNMKISLTQDDVSFIYHYDIDINKLYTRKDGRKYKLRKNYAETLGRVRDMFVLSCSLGQRYSDMVRIQRENFRNGVFTIVQQKTGNRASVNINELSMDKRTVYNILDKYNFSAPYRGNITNYNAYLKKLLYLIGGSFFDNVAIECKINGEIVKESVQKINLVSSHTARRTFATVNVNRSVQRSKIMAATGHTTEASFSRYLCEDD
jgi:integrase